jgi:hypothetical protein
MEIPFQPLVLKRKGGVGSERFECFSLIEGKVKGKGGISCRYLVYVYEERNDTKPTDEFRCTMQSRFRYRPFQRMR